MKIGVLLAGSGVYDGSEIQEAVFTLLAIDINKAEAVCFAPDKEQAHVINHLTGDEMPEPRNVLVESARIARGKIKPLSQISPNDFDALVIPGGFGPAKHFNEWAFSGPDGEMDTDVKRLIQDCYEENIPIAALCMGPTVVAQALQDEGIFITVGSTDAPSPYDIKAISEGIESLGNNTEDKTVDEITVDVKHKIVSAPCYMMEASIKEIQQNTQMAIDALIKLI